MQLNGGNATSYLRADSPPPQLHIAQSLTVKAPPPRLPPPTLRQCAEPPPPAPPPLALLDSDAYLEATRQQNQEPWYQNALSPWPQQEAPRTQPGTASQPSQISPVCTIPEFKRTCLYCRTMYESSLRSCEGCRIAKRHGLIQTERIAYYCNRDCQKRDWHGHKQTCPAQRHRYLRRRVSSPEEPLDFSAESQDMRE